MSIKVDELRVGNYILSEFGAFFLVRGISHKNKITASKSFSTVPVDFKITDFQPIKLTEEILLKCGFEKREDGDYNLFKYSEVDIFICSDFSSWKCDGINFSVGCVKYLHQLQNLYFALTNEELNVKL